MICHKALETLAGPSDPLPDLPERALPPGAMSAVRAAAPPCSVQILPAGN